MSEQEGRRAEFLTGAGWGLAEIQPLAGDASFRRYFRLRDGERKAMLMDAPPPVEDVRPFQRIARLLHQLDYSAPLILAGDPAGGFLLLEDLGDATYTRLIEAGADERMLYLLATDLLADMHARFDLGPAKDVPAYSDQRLLDEAALLTDWFLPAATGNPTDPDIRADYLARWAAVLPLARTVPDSLTLRDYHIDNLMYLEERPGLRACGLLDFQDAVIGPVAYDLVSLIEDARRDIGPEIVAACRARYLERSPGIDAAALDRSLAILGAQRHAKVIGIFCRLMKRDGKPGYLRHLPRLWRLIARGLEHPDLADMRAWFETHVPAPLRTIPESLQASASTQLGIRSPA
ncbi:MAG TPA: phosphotransferase [Stellaceae bacterium]|nr:phosphotransferase [Stellaceae bacterium]